LSYRRLFPSLIAFAVLLAGVMLAFFPLTGRKNSVFAIRAIPLEWKERLGGTRMETQITQEIEAGIGTRFQDVMGKRPWEVNLEALSFAIRKMPWIADASVSRALPDRLIVSIRPKRPLAVLVDAEKAQFRPLSLEGELMPAWESDVVPDVPFLRGARFGAENASGNELRKIAAKLIADLPAKGILARSNIVEIGYSEEQGFSLLLLSPRTEVRMGHDDLDVKVRRVGHVLNYLSTHGKRAPIIDSTSVKKVVVRAHHRP
jgi:hypothetical protein